MCAKSAKKRVILAALWPSLGPTLGFTELKVLKKTIQLKSVGKFQLILIDLDCNFCALTSKFRIRIHDAADQGMLKLNASMIQLPCCASYSNTNRYSPATTIMDRDGKWQKSKYAFPVSQPLGAFRSAKATCKSCTYWLPPFHLSGPSQDIGSEAGPEKTKSKWEEKIQTDWVGRMKRESRARQGPFKKHHDACG